MTRKKGYGLDHPIFENILVIILGKYLKGVEISRLARVNRFFGKVVPEIMRLLNVNWRPITEHRLDYNNQQQISMKRVDMATALAIQCGLDPGKIVRTLGGEYTGEWRNIKKSWKL